MRSKKILYSCIFISFISLNLFTSLSYAWSNYFRFINNFNQPMTVSINPTLASVNNSCGGNNSNITLNPHSTSCEFEFTTAQQHWYSSPGNDGTITLSLQNDPQSYCTYTYHYTYTLIPYSYFDIHSEVISLQSCQGSLQANEISLVNTHNKALARPLAGNIILNIDAEKAEQVTESLSQADCGGQGGDNCLILSPDLNTTYQKNGSTLGQALNLQGSLNRYEPLNFEQFIGSHNSAVSRQYTTSTDAYNLSYSDPDHYMTLTDQLNAGVRQLELDIEWYNNAVTLCHNHVAASLQGILCEGNAPIDTAISEIRNWVSIHQDVLVFVYLDVNLPLAGHVDSLDAALAKFEPYVFTPAMAEQYFKTTNNTLPAYQLSQDALINTYHKNIIITNDDDIDTLKTSQYVFVNVSNTTSTPLYESGVDGFLQSGQSCDVSHKYDTIKNYFKGDPAHYNLLRFNADRTVLNYVSSVGDKDPSQYSDYFTPQNLPTLMNCPVNIFSMNMLGFTCNDSSCTSHPTDPRLAEFLWSWSLGYPLQTGSNLAYINPLTAHFENDTLSPKRYAVLCYQASSKVTPVTPIQWFLTSIQLSDPTMAAQLATEACRAENGLFGVPTTSYWMDDVMSLIRAGNGDTVLVNYQNANGQWVPNGGIAL